MGAKGVKAGGRRQWTYPGAQGVGLGGGLQLGTGKEWEHRGTRGETGRTGEKKKVITGRKFREQQKCIKPRETTTGATGSDQFIPTLFLLTLLLSYKDKCSI